MPVYLCQCPTCTKTQDVYRTVAERDTDLPQCCGQTMPRVICAHEVIPDIAAYKSMVDGSIITSRNKHRNHLRQHNVTEVGNEKINRPETLAPLSREQRKDDIRRAAAQLRSR